MEKRETLRGGSACCSRKCNRLVYGKNSLTRQADLLEAMHTGWPAHRRRALCLYMQSLYLVAWARDADGHMLQCSGVADDSARDVSKDLVRSVRRVEAYVASVGRDTA